MHRRWGPISCALALACIGEEAQHKAAGNIRFRQGDVDGALREYAQAVKQTPSDAEAQVLYGNALFEKERYDQARAAFARAVAIMPEATAAHRGLAKVALRQHRGADAERHLGDVLSHDAHDREALRDLAGLRAERGDLAGAEELLLRAAAAARHDVRTLYPLALVQTRRGETDAALATADALAAAEPERGFADYVDALARALAKGVDDIGQVEADQNLAALRTHPRFRELLSQAREDR